MKKLTIAGGFGALIVVAIYGLNIKQLIEDRTVYGINRMERLEVVRGILRLRRQGRKISEYIDLTGIKQLGFAGYDVVCQEILKELELDGIKPSFIVYDGYCNADLGIDVYHSRMAPQADLVIIPAESDPESKKIIARGDKVVILADILKGIKK